MSNKVSMTFVGLGWWSDMLATAANASERISIAGGMSRSAQKREVFAGKFGGTAYETFESMLAEPSIDAIVMTTPNSVHADQCIAAARAGKHVFLEKPMALTVEECRRMIAAADEAGIVLANGLNKRRMAAFRKAADIVGNGGVGKIALLEANSSSGFGLTATPDKWRWSRRESPGGPLNTHTIHHIDVFNLLLGVPKRVSAFARKLGSPMEADDVVTACLEFESGALGYLGATFMSPVRKYFNLFGTEGLIHIEEDTGALSYKKAGASSFEVFAMPDTPTQQRASLKEELDEFARCIQQGTRPEVGGQEGLAAVAVVEAIVRSAEIGAAVSPSA